MSTPTGVAPLVADLQLMRDEIVKVAGVPFKRLLVYKLTVPLPLPPEGMALFAIAKGFIIGSITTSLTDQFVNDASYILQDIADGENIGVVVARAGHEGLLPIAVPDLPADLGGPSKIFIKPLDGIQDTDGTLVFQIAISGPPSSGDGIFLDQNQDGVPDELAEKVLPYPSFEFAGTFDDFYAGYETGLSGVSTQ